MRLVNPLNARQHWSLSARRARRHRDGVSAAVLAALGRTWRLRVPAARPKQVVFHAYVGRPLDDDGLVASLKSIRDGLMDAGLINDDAPIHGHRFTYHQHPGTPASARGVRIEVRCA